MEGFFLGMTETLVSAYGGSVFKDAVAFSILIIVLLIKPNGLLGKTIKKRYRRDKENEKRIL